MPFKVFTPTVLSSSDMNTYLMNQVVVQCTAGSRPSSPPTGMVIYETDTDTFRYWNGTAWKVTQVKRALFSSSTTGLTTGIPSEPFYSQIGQASLTTAADGKASVNLPSAFPNGLMSAIVCPWDGVTTQCYLTGSSISSSAFQIQARDATGTARASTIIKVSYIAYGW